MNKLVTLFSSVKNNSNTKSWSMDLSCIAQIISNPEDSFLKDRVNKCRLLYRTNKDAYKKLKQTLPCFTCSGQFSERNSSHLQQYSNYVCLDFDHFPSDETMLTAKSSFSRLPFVSMVFISPSHRGLKVVVHHHNNNPAMHGELFKQLKAYPQFMLMEFDDKVKDIARATFLSYDPLLYYNPDAVPFHFDLNKVAKEEVSLAVVCPKPSGNVTNKQHSTANTIALPNTNFGFIDGHSDKQIINFLNNHFWKRNPIDYTDGHRHESLLKKAGTLCAYGVSFEAALSELLYRYTYKGLTEDDVTRAVKCEYSHVPFGYRRTEIISMMDYSGTVKPATIEAMNNLSKNK